ncbi:hypothetical protein BD779DRAFT_1582168 [Infundibulicybe gibba]|nr:hypothetical protein BD779DRAFT_1582168 [Infundibulicybe gibba]
MGVTRGDTTGVTYEIFDESAIDSNITKEFLIRQRSKVAPHSLCLSFGIPSKAGSSKSKSATLPSTATFQTPLRQTSTSIKYRSRPLSPIERLLASLLEARCAWCASSTAGWLWDLSPSQSGPTVRPMRLTFAVSTLDLGPLNRLENRNFFSYSSNRGEWGETYAGGLERPAATSPSSSSGARSRPSDLWRQSTSGHQDCGGLPVAFVGFTGVDVCVGVGDDMAVPPTRIARKGCIEKRDEQQQYRFVQQQYTI